jgi:ELWxxDGT repeat protein
VKTNPSAGLTAFVLLAATALQAQVPYRVKDINPSTTPAFAGQANPLVRVGSEIFFPAEDPVNGRELWHSDGTPEGSGLVKDLSEGVGSSNPGLLADVNGTLFFTTSLNTSLWKSDGTTDGTIRLKTFTRMGPIAAFAGEAFFGADGNLWKSDGTVEGTVMVAVIRPGGESPVPLAVVGSRLLFRADDGVSGQELWTTDGTPEGTTLVRDINPGPNGSALGPPTVVGGTAFFQAFEPSAGAELWKSDGTAAGTVRVRDIAPGPTSSAPMSIVVAGGVLYFSASTPSTGYELWRSDGSEAGTVMVRDLRPGPDGSFPHEPAVVGGLVYFSALPPTGIGFGSELWRSDGTESGTVLVRDAIGMATGSSPRTLTAGDTVLYYSADDLVWRTDGTAAGTTKVDVNPGPGTAFPLAFQTIGDVLFFSATDSTGSRLWRMDGTTTRRLDLPVTALAPSNPGPFVAFEGVAYFSADDGLHGRELWRTDGTEAGTALVSDLRPGTASGDPRAFVTLDGVLYFNVLPGQLWRTDGTADGLFRATPLTVSAGPAVAVPSRGLLFFCGSDATHGTELWRTDGTEAGTALIKDIVPGTGFSLCGNITDVGGTVFFTATQPTTGVELWRTDGTEAGTVLVKDITPGTRASNPANLVNLNGTLLFSAFDVANGIELWRSDGTSEGTVLVKDVRPGPQSAAFSSPVAIGDRVYLVADDGTNGFEPWVTDGTADGTHLLKDIAPGTAGSLSSTPLVLGDRILFIASDGAVLKLWATDGTEVGTEAIVPLPAGGAGGAFVFGDTMFFSARDDEAGGEPWRTDGSASGTARVADVVPGYRSSSPILFGALGSVLLFSAMDDTAGRELWALDLNHAPAAQAGADQTVEAGISVTLDGSASSDRDGDPLTYEWRDASGGVLGREPTLLVSGLLPGAYGYTLLVSDGRITSSDVVSVTVLVPPTIVIGDASVREGRRRDPGFALFEVRLSRPSGRDVSVHYRTENGTAQAPRDYVAASGMLQFAPGSTSMTVAVMVNGDRRCERDERFFVVLDSAVNATLGAARGTATILNDDCGSDHR